MAGVLLAQFFVDFFPQITWVLFSPFRIRLLGWRILCSGDKADSRHRESHLAKVQGEHISSAVASLLKYLP